MSDSDSADGSVDGGALRLHAPAKINLMLAVHGRRADGFHELTSLVTALRFGDDLTVSPAMAADVLSCDDPEVPLGGDNLILRAARAFREATGAAGFFHFDLEKRIPMGAGLGGGSSDAATALLAMNRISGQPLDAQQLRELAAGLGSDCPFFVDPVPSLMRGRGEVVEPLQADLRKRLTGRRVWLFRPAFPVSTVWAYGALAAAAPASYASKGAAEEALEAFRRGRGPETLLQNSFEAVVGGKFLAIPTLLDKLRRDFDLPCLMSGSGSCCFSLPEEGRHPDAGTVEALVRSAWGAGAFWVETSLA